MEEGSYVIFVWSFDNSIRMPWHDLLRFKNMSSLFNFIYHIGSSVYVCCAATTVTNLVLPRMRAMAGVFFILTEHDRFVGPYTLGRISDLFELQGYALVT